MVDCLVIARNPTRDHDKFNPGLEVYHVYSYGILKNKDNKLLNLPNNTMFVSRDTKFYEHIYPYQVFNSNAAKQTPLQLNVDDFEPSDF